MRYDEKFDEVLEEERQINHSGKCAGKKKGIALVLAVLFGIVGLHDLYLDRMRRWLARLPLPLALVVLLNFTQIENLFVQRTLQNMAAIIVAGLLCLWWIVDIFAILLMPAAMFEQGQEDGEEQAEEEFGLAPKKEDAGHVALYRPKTEILLFGDEGDVEPDDGGKSEESKEEAQYVKPYPGQAGAMLFADDGEAKLSEDEMMDALAEEPPIVAPEPAKEKKEKLKKKKRAGKFVAAKAEAPLEGAQPAVIAKLPEEESVTPKVAYVETAAKVTAAQAAQETPVPVPVPNVQTNPVSTPWKLHKYQTQETGNAPLPAKEQGQVLNDETLQEIYTAIDKFDVMPLQQKYSIPEREARAVLFLTHCTRQFGENEDIVRNMVQHYRLLPQEATRIAETFVKQQQ